MKPLIVKKAVVKEYATLPFQTAEERKSLICDGADYFTACRFIDRKRIREEAPNLEAARAIAHLMLLENPKPVLIYAVQGVHDTYVETVK